MFQSRALEALVDELKKLPGVGKKSATRIALHLLRAPREEVDALARRMRDVREKVRLCGVCGNYTEEETCSICTDARRDASLLCVVEQPSDIALLESTGSYRGVYHVLHGVLSPLEGVRPEALRIEELVRRTPWSRGTRRRSSSRTRSRESRCSSRGSRAACPSEERSSSPTR
jgi:recombination protein RecR